LTETTSERAPTSRLWHHVDFRRLWFATTVSQLGTQVSELAIPLTAISLLHASAFQVGVLAAAGYVPLAVFGLAAGARVDRVRRRSVLLATDLGRGIVLASIPLAYAVGHVTMAQLDVVALAVGTLTVFFDVAYPTFLPTLLEPRDLARGNSRLQVSEQGAAVIGPGLAGWLIGVVGAPLAVAVDAASYFGSAAFVRRIAPRERALPRPPSKVRMRIQIAEGLRYVMADRRLFAIAVASGIANLFGRMAVVVVVIYLARSVGYSATAIGVVFAIGGVGFVVGAALADRVIDRVGLGPAIVAGGCVAGLSFVLMAAPPRSAAGPFVAAAMFVYGLGALTFTVGNATLRQLTVPPEILGRVTSSMRLLVWIAQPVAALLGGWLASRIGLHGALWIGAAGMLLMPAAFLGSGLLSVRQLTQRAADTS
jgi:MFS family permease